MTLNVSFFLCFHCFLLVSFILHLSAVVMCNAVLLVCQGERGPIGPAMVGPRGIPGIPGERGELVSVTRSLLLFP